MRRPSAGQLSRPIADQESREVTYAEHAGIMPSGYHHDRWEADLGSFSPDRIGIAG